MGEGPAEINDTSMTLLIFEIDCLISILGSQNHEHGKHVSAR